MVKRKNKKGGGGPEEPIETEVPSPQPLQSESIMKN